MRVGWGTVNMEFNYYIASINFFSLSLSLRVILPATKPSYLATKIIMSRSISSVFKKWAVNSPIYACSLSRQQTTQSIVQYISNITGLKSLARLKPSKIWENPFKGIFSVF